MEAFVRAFGDAIMSRHKMDGMEGIDIEMGVRNETYVNNRETDEMDVDWMLDNMLQQGSNLLQQGSNRMNPTPTRQESTEYEEYEGEDDEPPPTLYIVPVPQARASEWLEAVRHVCFRHVMTVCHVFVHTRR